MRYRLLSEGYEVRASPDELTTLQVVLVQAFDLDPSVVMVDHAEIRDLQKTLQGARHDKDQRIVILDGQELSGFSLILGATVASQSSDLHRDSHVQKLQKQIASWVWDALRD